MEKRFGEYADRGDYHVDLPQDWPYLPVYLEKMILAHKFLDACKPNEVVYDMGCGEGVLVNEYRRKGLNITGIDLNYSSEFVRKGSFIESGLPDASVDVLTCLDVIEHLNFADQERAFAEFAASSSPADAPSSPCRTWRILPRVFRSSSPANSCAPPAVTVIPATARWVNT
jgi:hypothetical protein